MGRGKDSHLLFAIFREVQGAHSSFLNLLLAPFWEVCHCWIEHIFVVIGLLADLRRGWIRILVLCLHSALLMYVGLSNVFSDSRWESFEFGIGKMADRLFL